jgi:hypothetical protein
MYQHLTIEKFKKKFTKVKAKGQVALKKRFVYKE